MFLSIVSTQITSAESRADAQVIAAQEQQAAMSVSRQEGDAALEASSGSASSSLSQGAVSKASAISAVDSKRTDHRAAFKEAAEADFAREQEEAAQATLVNIEAQRQAHREMFLQQAEGSMHDASGEEAAQLKLQREVEAAAAKAESDARKAAFLREASRICGAGATIINARAEVAEAPAADVVTARACAPLSRLLPWVFGQLRADGTALLLKGANWRDELTAAEKGWTLTAAKIPSRTDASGVILKLEGLNPN